METLEEFGHLAGLDTPVPSPGGAAKTGQGRGVKPGAVAAVRSPNPSAAAAAPSPAVKKTASKKAPVFATESTREMFARYDVDGSGSLDFEEVSLALADMGALVGLGLGWQHLSRHVIL